jgi:hypothetical protein
MRQALIGLEELRSVPALPVERSAPSAISVASVLERSETRH